MGRKYYIGHFEQGTFNGLGTIYWQNGEKFNGRWAEGKMLDGIYTWADGVKARAAIHEGRIIFGLPLIFPEDDFRKEYNGSIKDGFVLFDDG